MTAEILSYSRNKGLFAGVSLEGSTLRSDGSANEKLYGQKLSARDIIRRGKVKNPAVRGGTGGSAEQEEPQESLRSKIVAVTVDFVGTGTLARLAYPATTDKP